jgi:hypothetical protein
MIPTRFCFRRPAFVLGFLAAALPGPAPAAALRTVDTRYAPDLPFPQFLHLWTENWGLRGEDGEPKAHASATMPLGAYVHVVVHNDSPVAATINDVKFEGLSLTAAIAFSDKPVANQNPASVHFARLAPAELARLTSNGEPVWWKADPLTVPPGEFAELTIRLRRPLTNAAVTVEAVTEQGDCRSQVAAKPSPRFEAINFSPARDTLYAYVRSPQSPQPAPTRIFFDGRDVTAAAKIVSDARVDAVPLVLRLGQPLKKGSLHFLQARFASGPPAGAAARAWGEDLVYGMWGYTKQGATPQERVDFFLGDLRRHQINTVMFSYPAEVADYLSGESGLEHSRRTGIRAMRTAPGRDLNPVYYFLMDEPDAHDFAVNDLPPDRRLGALGQDLVRAGARFRAADPATPQLLNVDNTYKPENWYTYAQLADVFCADPYYQEQQRIVWNDRPAWAASFVKPLYVLGVATVGRWACAPKPLHLILNSVRHNMPDGFRFATPEEKTVELFYALGGGATSFSYWWYTPYGEFLGCGAAEKAAVALWRQIGLLGAQVRTAGPLLTRSCPATLPLQAPAKLWTRTLLSGADTVVLLAVNDNIASDRLGTVVVPLPQTVVRLTLPDWLTEARAFEITPEGTRDVNGRVTDGAMTLDLGRTRLARMVVITGDPSLRARLEQRHRDQFAQNVASLLREAE